MECIDNPSNNCCKGGNCSSSICSRGYSCCWEKTNNPTYGMCVKNGNCDSKRGIPVKNCKADKSSISEGYDKYEKIAVISEEGYRGNSTSKIILWSILVLMVVALICACIISKKA